MIELTIPEDENSSPILFTCTGDLIELKQDDDEIDLTPSQALALSEVLKKLVVVQPTFRKRLSDD
ncbi:hypothetical protein SEA_WEASELS2_20 [Rhodococcus phage Weasels2]|uniref:Uncharacterized protein n=1 Tax=Rhodococcus phage Weasels2 TaxID=1897437 RepID=A0A1I9SA04_9CAUD|nr:hypothetical protein FDH04_gp020 [Rhodococcus phage Weasels2]AOZ63610.1 hypothetical protein SEA_WEASELS2_20 [Rhodococcus phage Weasels2]